MKYCLTYTVSITIERDDEEEAESDAETLIDCALESFSEEVVDSDFWPTTTNHCVEVTSEEGAV